MDLCSWAHFLHKRCSFYYPQFHPLKRIPSLQLVSIMLQHILFPNVWLGYNDSILLDSYWPCQVHQVLLKSTHSLCLLHHMNNPSKPSDRPNFTCTVRIICFIWTMSVAWSRCSSPFLCQCAARTHSLWSAQKFHCRTWKYHLSPVLLPSVNQKKDENPVN